MLVRSFDFELLLCFSVYVVYVAYGVWRVYAVRDDVLALNTERFASGWLADRPCDDSNDDLGNLVQYLKDNWFWYIAHVVASAATGCWWPQRQSTAHAIVGALSIFLTCTLRSVATIAICIISYYLISLCRSKILTWLLTVLWVVIANIILTGSVTRIYNITYSEYIMVYLIFSWSVLRCSSFALNRAIDEATGRQSLERMYSLEYFLGYALYLPNLVHGPFWDYPRYTALYQRNKTPLRLRGLSLVFQLLRSGFWLLAIQFSLHFFYIHYMTEDVAAVELVQPAFMQHSVYYFIGLYFYLYYLVSYGIAIALARFDGIDAPDGPRCIGYVHYYSDMWKYFDTGLYEYLFKHIYIELCRKNSSMTVKLFATAATFTFVFVWHGGFVFVLIWSILNFICLVAEKCYRSLFDSAAYNNWSQKHLSACNAQRLRAFAGTHIFLPAALANVYFISGGTVAIFISRGLHRNGIWNYLILIFCSYCYFQCSEFIYQRTRREKKPKQT